MNYSLLSDAVVNAINTAVNAIIQWFYGLLFDILIWLKEVFDFCYVLVRKLAGIDTYYYNGQLMGYGEGSGSASGDIIEVLLKSDIVRNLFITLLVLGVVLLFIITFICIWKTEWEFGKEQNSKTKIWNSVIRALFNFIAVPVITFFGIFVGNALLRAIDDATAGGTNVRMSDIVMTSIATNALRAEHQGDTLNYELISKNNTVNADNGKLGIYQYFMNAKGEIVAADILSAFKNNSTLKAKDVYYVDTTDLGIDSLGVNQKLQDGTLVFSFTEKQVVGIFFDKSKFNYVLGYIVLIIMLKTMLEITFGLVKRLFYIVFLFIVSPPIVAMTPLNEKPLGEWRKAFVGHFCSAFVTIGFFNIFMSIYPLFDRISFFPASSALSLLNGFVSLLMVCVGLLVINEISKFVSEIIFGKGYDVISQSGTGWGAAFGLAGRALKPATLPAKAIGKGAEFATRARYQGLGVAAKETWEGTKGVAKKAVNAGPLKDLWEKSTANQAAKSLSTSKMLKKEWGVADVKKAVNRTIKDNKSEQKEAFKTLGMKRGKGDRLGLKAAQIVQQGEQGVRNAAYNKNKAIADEYYKKKEADINYKATKEELSAVRSMMAHKNFGHDKKHEAENALIGSSGDLSQIGNKHKAVTNLVRDKIIEENKLKDKKDQTKVSMSKDRQDKAKAAKEAIVKNTAKKDAEKDAKKTNKK